MHLVRYTHFYASALMHIRVQCMELQQEIQQSVIWIGCQS